MRGRPTLVAATLASGITSLPTTGLGVALPTIHAELNATLSELQWTLTAYSLAYASLLIVAGRLGDIFGHRKFFLAGTMLFGAGSISAALAQDPLRLIVSLAVIGAGGAMIVPASLSIVTNAFGGHGRVKAIALWGGASGLVSGLGPPVGGILTEVAGWPSIFWVSLGIAALILAFALPGVAESRDETAERTIDYGGVLCLAGAITTLSLGLIEGPSWGWLSTPTVVSFALSATLLIGLVLVERRSANPVVELSVLRHRNFIGGMVVKLVVNFVLAGLLFMLPIYLQEILHYSPLEAGVLLLPLSGTFLLSLPLGGRLMEHYGPRLPIVAGLFLATAGLFFIADVSPSTSYVDLWPPMLGLGFGVGLVLTPMNTTAVNAVPLRQHGQATGILTTVIGLGSVLGVAITAAVFRTLEDARLDHVLARTGPRLPDPTERLLEGVLVHAQNAEQELARFGLRAQENIIRAVREAFVFGISNALTVSVAVAAAGALLTLLILKRPTARSSG